LNTLAIPLFVFLLLASVFVTLGFRSVSESDGEPGPHVQELTALALGFLLVPWLGWIAGVMALNAFVDRYVLYGLFGVFLLVPLLAARFFQRSRLLGLALLVACGLPGFLSMARGIAGDFRPAVQHNDFALLERELSKLPGDIVVSNPLLFDELVDYSPALKAKCIYLLDRENELRYTHITVMTQTISNFGQVAGFRTAEWKKYNGRNAAFLFLTVPDSESDELVEWLRPYLRANRRYGEVVMKIGRYVVVRAEPGDVR
jgi:hypothetical protein